MKVPARCNKRACQARRTLPKRMTQYRDRPKCHMPDCSGLMLEDKYRLRQGEKDNAPECRLDCYHHPHRVSSRNCKGREDYLLDRLLAPKSKHSPFKDEPNPF